MTNFQPILDLISQNKLDEAALLISPILEAEPANPEAWFALGCLQHNRKDSQWAIQSYKKAIELDPAHSRSLNNYARLLRSSSSLDDHVEARRAFKELKKLIPDAASPRSVYIGLPHYGHTDPAFEESLMAMITTIKPEHNMDWMACRCEGSRISSNRNRLAQDAMKKHATHILFIDTDMDFPPDAMLRMLAWDKDIVCATTCKRGDDTGTPIGQAVSKQDGTDALQVTNGQGLIEMNLIGACFMMIKLDVFDKIRQPAFYEPPNYADNDAFGEDITFCKMVREAGFQIWMDFDLSVQLGHWGRKRYHIKPKVSHG
jgi:tetratricopeptide (TPR) repeat protein